MDQVRARQGAMWMTVVSHVPWIAFPQPAQPGQPATWKIAPATQVARRP